MRIALSTQRREQPVVVTAEVRRITRASGVGEACSCFVTECGEKRS